MINAPTSESRTAPLYDRALLLARNLLALFIAGLIVYTAVNHVTSMLASNDASLHQGDFGIFGEMTRTLTSGEKLYVDFWDTKPPGMFFALAPFVLVFGNTLLALHFATLTFFALFVASSAGLTYALTHSRAASLTAGLLALMYTSRQLGPETTYVMTMFGTLATWAAVHARGRIGWLVVAGALFAFGCLTKQPLVVALPALCLFAGMYAPRHRIRAIVATLAGVGIVGALVLLWAASQGILEAMIYRVVQISSQYVLAEDGGWHFRDDSWELFRTYFLGQTWSHFRPLFILGALAVPILWLTKHQRSSIILLVVWFIFSFIGAAIPRGWRADYFIQVAPPLIVLIASAVMILGRLRPVWQIPFFVIAAYLIGMHAREIAIPFSTLFGADTTEQYIVLDIIERETEPDDCIWMWGSVSYFNYLSGHDSCMSAALDGFLMDSTTFPIRRTRAENLREMVYAHPTLYITERIWGFYPELNDYAERYLGEALHDGPRYEVRRVDRSMWRETDMNFGNEIRLIGYDLLPVDGPYCAGETLTLAMTWQQISRPTHQYQMFVQLLTPDETVRAAGYDGPPEDGNDRNATNTWVDTGEIRLGDRFELVIPPDTAPGNYKLIAGLYDVVTAERLPVVDSNGTPVGPYTVVQPLDIRSCDT